MTQRANLKLQSLDDRILPGGAKGGGTAGGEWAQVLRHANDASALVALPDDVGSKPGGTGEGVHGFEVPAGHGGEVRL